MKATPFPARNCWRLQIPAKFNNGKAKAIYFKDEPEADRYIATLTGQTTPTVGIPPVPVNDKQMALMQELLDQYKAQLAQIMADKKQVKRTGTVSEMMAAYQVWELTQSRTVSTIRNTSDAAKAFLKTFGTLKTDAGTIITPPELTHALIDGWINKWPIGSSSRNTYYRFIHKVLAWASDNEWMVHDPMVKIKRPPGKSSKFIIRDFADWERILRAAAGLDPLSPLPPLPDDFKASSHFRAQNDYTELLPVLVLGGFAGIRTGEMAPMNRNQKPVLLWSDIYWEKNYIDIRDGVAKKTSREKGDQRYITIQPALAAWLKPFAKTSGKVFNGTTANITELKRQLFARLEIKRYGRNIYRHSFASYSTALRGAALTAVDMGDLEKTIVDKYVDRKIEPGMGAAYFAIRPDSNIIPMPAEQSAAA